MDKFVNFSLLKNPLNWIVIYAVAAFGMTALFALDKIGGGNPPSS